MEGQLSEYSTVTINKSAASVNGLNQFKGYADVVNGNNDIVVKAVDQNHNTKNQKYAINHVAQDEFSYAYDLNGNLTTETNITQGTTRTFEWDSADNLVAINAGTKRSEFTYNAQKQRIGIKEKINGVVTYDKKFQWLGSAIIEQRTADGSTVEKEYLGFGEYTHLAGVDTKYYYFTDHQGSVREVLNDSKTVVAKYDYSIWGTRTKISGAYDTEIGYTGHYTHSTSGLDLTHFRAYDSKLGRWLSPEPLGESENLNLYRLGYNSPLSGFDYSGLFWGSFGTRLFANVAIAVNFGIIAAGVASAFPLIAPAMAVAGAALLGYAFGNVINGALNYRNLSDEEKGELVADGVTVVVSIAVAVKLNIPKQGKPGTYIPKRTLPVDEQNVPVPDCNSPHTQLGLSRPKFGSEPQARTWDNGSNGKLQPIKDIDFSCHGKPDIHPNPHQHVLTPNNPSLAPKGGYQRGDPEPLVY